ncbi:PASTA domain-containing protein [Nocardioides zeae]|uniref:PASTA domain-containing protein n=1 Tax=Nocardioides zeae TaxID=1457234 RepID=A0AAJ1TWF7_9ACTN|nr:hypothetical protein [Nocardioides zeae]MDQ1103280.1 hypothetical protein [Nocardioides zeae]
MPQVRRGLVVVATLAAVGAGALVVGTVGMVAASEPAHRPMTSVAAAADVGEPALDRRVPEGHRLVGHGRLGLAVPEEWPTDAIECNGEPVADTVVNPMYVFCAMATPAAPDVTAVELGRAWGSGPSADEAGVAASPPVSLSREPTVCDDALGGAVVCRAVVTDGAGSALTVRSTIADRAGAVAAVAALADAVFLLEADEVVVPSEFGPGAFADFSSDAYRERLEAAGLEVDVVEVRRLPAAAGRFVAVDPAVSTILPRGATVRLEVAEQ